MTDIQQKMNSPEITIHGSRGAVRYDVSDRIATLPDGTKMTVQGLIRWGRGSGHGYVESDAGTFLDAINYVPVHSRLIPGRTVPAIMSTVQFMMSAASCASRSLSSCETWNIFGWKPVRSRYLPIDVDLHAGPVSFKLDGRSLKVFCLSGSESVIWARSIPRSMLGRECFNLAGVPEASQVACIARDGSKTSITNGCPMLEIYQMITKIA